MPALFGTFFLNVFGGYAIARMTGTPPGLGGFWWQWLTEPAPRQVQHLWFLFSLAIYTPLLWPLMLAAPRLARLSLPVPGLLAALVAASALVVLVFKPHAPALTGNGYQFPYYLLFFAGGYLIGARHAAVLDWTRARVWWLLAAAVVLFLAKATLLTLALLDDIPTGQALAAGGWVPLGLMPAQATAFSVIEAATAWAWCLAALGLAARFLDRPGPLLAQLNRAVFPVYVLHFPVTLVGLALVAQIVWPWWVEFVLLLAAVYAVSWGLWRLADRLGPAVWLIGGRPPRPAATAPAAARTHRALR